MADHYLQTIALLDEVEDVRAQIAEQYAIPRVPPARPGLPAVRKPGVQELLNALHARRTELMTLAKIHSTLAAAQIVAQAVRDSSASGAVL